ncbi:MAG TPA: GNAT family N-acetyltransferase [Stellaceae bacterium]|nr:GNAT family N-acetyltransferase [Stellaceae bacterium]
MRAKLAAPRRRGKTRRRAAGSDAAMRRPLLSGMMAAMSPVSLHPARSAADIAEAAALFRDYAAALDVDLCFQGFDEELATLPGKYGPPRGELLLARGADGAPLGCVALRPLDAPQLCEMKRLYVRDAARGHGAGRALVAAIIAAAEARGYAEMRLDSLPSMTAALALYRRFGFAEIPAYCFNPVPGTVYLALSLRSDTKRG